MISISTCCRRKKITCVRRIKKWPFKSGFVAPTFNMSLAKSDVSVNRSSILVPSSAIPVPLFTSLSLWPQASQVVAIMRTSLKNGISFPLLKTQTADFFCSSLKNVIFCDFLHHPTSTPILIRTQTRLYATKQMCYVTQESLTRTYINRNPLQLNLESQSGGFKCSTYHRFPFIHSVPFNANYYVF